MQLFFIHGSGCTGDVFSAQLRAFGNAYATTLPGHRGDPLDSASIGGYADAVAVELRERRCDVVLCGSSMGGAIALELGLRSDPHVRGVVMLGSGARLRVAPAVFESLERDFPAGARALAKMFFAQPSAERVDATVEMMLGVGQAQTLLDFHACNAFDATERIADLKVPLLAITGADDVLTPPKFAHFLADRVPDAAARILPGAGHLAMIEQPAETNAALAQFVEQIGKPERIS